MQTAPDLNPGACVPPALAVTDRPIRRIMELALTKGRNGVPVLASLSDRFNPLVLATIAGWVLCVCLHEFAHAITAYFGGDRSVREKGYLTLDPTRFIDPVSSLILPAIVLLLGGVPLPGGAVQIDESALRNRRWAMYVPAAGPGANLLLFLLFSLPLHPLVGLVDATAGHQPTWVHFIAAMAFLNFIGALFNLIPVPPLDGYRLIEHRLSPELQWKLRQPQASMITFGLLFMVMWSFDWAWIPFLFMLEIVASLLGVPTNLIYGGYGFVFHSSLA